MKIKVFYVLLALLVISGTMFRILVISDFEKQKLVEVQETEKNNRKMQIRDALIIADEHEFFAELITEMYEHKDTLYMSDDFEVKNKEEFVNQFINYFESDLSEAYLFVYDFYGMITFIEELEVEDGEYPQAQYWYYVNDKEPILVESEDGKQKFDQLKNRHLTKITYEYDPSTNKILTLVSTMNMGHMNFHKYMKDIRFISQGSGFGLISNLPIQSARFSTSFMLEPSFIATSENKDIKLKKINVVKKSRLEHR